MGTWKFRKPEPSNVQGICVSCNKNPQRPKGKGKYKAICRSCDRKNFTDLDKHRKHVDRSKRPYRNFVKDVCERCGFVPEHLCQLDVDHINGDHKDNREENLQTLCANCHRLKTLQSKDWET